MMDWNHCALRTAATHFELGIFSNWNPIRRLQATRFKKFLNS